MTQAKQGTVTKIAAVVNLDGATDSGSITQGTWNGQNLAPAYLPSPGAAGYGTVTSVALEMPAELFATDGSPITTDGTFTVTLPTKAAHQVFAGPVSGEALSPIFRALVAADIPSLPFSQITGTVPTTQGGTGLTSFTSTGVFYASSTSVVAQAAVNSTATRKYLLQVSSGVPVFTQVAAADISGLAASATTDTTVASNISSGTLPSGRLTGAYTGVTGVGILAAGSSSAPSLQLGETNSGWNFAASHMLVAVSNGQANGPQVYHDGSRYRTEFPTVGNWLTWNNASNGVVLVSPAFSAANDGVFLISGFGTSKAGIDFASKVRLKNDGAATNLKLLNSAETTAAAWSAARTLDNGAGAVTVAKTDSGVVYVSDAGARTVTLPTPANSFVGQDAYLVQGAAHVLTLGIPAGVTVTMYTTAAAGVSTYSSKTGVNTFASTGSAGTDGTSAHIVCVSTDGSTVATWRQVSGGTNWA